MIKEFLNKKIGKHIVSKLRTKPWHFFSGMTIRQWLVMPFRITFMLPVHLMLVSSTYISEKSEQLYYWLDETMQ